MGPFVNSAQFSWRSGEVRIALETGTGGEWHCARAISRMHDIVGRHGPMQDGVGPERDLTAEVQLWLDRNAPAAKEPQGGGARAPLLAASRH